MPFSVPHLLAFSHARLDILDPRVPEHHVLQLAEKLGTEGGLWQENGRQRCLAPKRSSVQLPHASYGGRRCKEGLQLGLHGAQQPREPSPHTYGSHKSKIF